MAMTFSFYMLELKPKFRKVSIYISGFYNFVCVNIYKPDTDYIFHKTLDINVAICRYIEVILTHL